MLRWILPFACLLFGPAAQAAQCLPQPDEQTALARSVQEGVAMGVPDGSPWWAVSNSSGQWCIMIEDAPRQIPGDGQMVGYDFTANPVPNALNGVPANAVGLPTGLTAQEKITLQSAVTVNLSVQPK